MIHQSGGKNPIFKIIPYLADPGFPSGLDLIFDYQVIFLCVAKPRIEKSPGSFKPYALLTEMKAINFLSPL
jgi:hypothetical protein